MISLSELKEVFAYLQQTSSQLPEDEFELPLKLVVKRETQQPPKLTWKALAESHLRERIPSFSKFYRRLSIELYAMEQVGYDWRPQFYTYGGLSRYLSTLFNVFVDSKTLTNRIDDLDLQSKKYEIDDAIKYWGQMTSKKEVK